MEPARVPAAPRRFDAGSVPAAQAAASRSGRRLRRRRGRGRGVGLARRRQQIMLLFAGGHQLPVGEIAESCGLGQSTTSEQLAILKRGLVQSTRDGKIVRYRADPTTIAARLAELQNYLACCCPPEGASR